MFVERISRREKRKKIHSWDKVKGGWRDKSGVCSRDVPKIAFMGSGL